MKNDELLELPKVELKAYDVENSDLGTINRRGHDRHLLRKEKRGEVLMKAQGCP